MCDRHARAHFSSIYRAPRSQDDSSSAEESGPRKKLSGKCVIDMREHISLHIQGTSFPGRQQCRREWAEKKAVQIQGLICLLLRACRINLRTCSRHILIMEAGKYMTHRFAMGLYYIYIDTRHLVKRMTAVQKTVAISDHQ